MSRKTYPQQAELKTAILSVLADKPYIILSDVAHDACVPYSTLYFWLNGTTMNMQTAAYLEALASWVEDNR